MNFSLLRNKKVIIVLAVIFLIAAGFLLFKKDMFKKNNMPKNLSKIEIAVDASKKIGEMPYVYRSGIWLQGANNFKYIFDKFAKENVLGTIQLDIVNELVYSKSFDDFKSNTEEKYAPGTIFRDAIEEIKKSGQLLVIGQFPNTMPEWLSSRAGDNRRYSGTEEQSMGFVFRSIAPPKCYGYKCTNLSEITCLTQECTDITKKQLAEDGYVVGWASVVDYAVKYFRNELGVRNLGYYFGHEQNKDWFGSEEDFYKMYAATAQAVKAIDKNILVGGSGAWGALAPRIKCAPPHFNQAATELCKSISDWSMNGDASANKNFLEYAKKYNLPVDFLNWHSFGLYPAEFSRQTNEIHSWLKSNNFNQNMPLFPADWTVWAGDYPGADYIDTEYNPPYVVSALYNMDKAGIQWQGHDFNVGSGVSSTGGVEKWAIQQRGGSEFIGEWAIFSRNKIVKPVYNAFKAVSIFNGKQENQTPNRLDVNYDDTDFITTIASQTQDKSKTRILLSNFIPADDMLMGYLLEKFNSFPSMQSTKEYKNQIKGCIEEDATAPSAKNKITQCIDKITTTITDPVIKERVSTQVELFNCFKSSREKDDRIRCVDDAYNKTKDQQTKADIEAIRAEYQKILQYQKEPRRADINISNLPFSGQATLTTYIIDKDLFQPFNF